MELTFRGLASYIRKSIRLELLDELGDTHPVCWPPTGQRFSRMEFDECLRQRGVHISNSSIKGTFGPRSKDNRCSRLLLRQSMGISVSWRVYKTSGKDLPDSTW